jgi:hypothetical protein
VSKKIGFESRNRFPNVIYQFGDLPAQWLKLGQSVCCATAWFFALGLALEPVGTERLKIVRLGSPIIAMTFGHQVEKANKLPFRQLEQRRSLISQQYRIGLFIRGISDSGHPCYQSMICIATWITATTGGN